ncbi:hypothetical protein HPB52_022239 [Rhipicephalus sanguineus]|uniref:Uncharacterized protein n=1 Tax=Rhipicephalus sanguineus TaxID=34632 RepID=A0A9D4TBV0_RHISA|nr:hypothetical protein HPB52_022239 [Rhipicephalus sanguineus]
MSRLRGSGCRKHNESKCRFMAMNRFGQELKMIADRNGKHKKCKKDLRKAHDGTAQFTSPNVHNGEYSLRGHMELLGYNLLMWSGCRLYWQDNLKKPDYVSQQKSKLLENIPLLMSKCFQHRDIPCGITQFLQYTACMKFEKTPNCRLLKRISEKGIQSVGFKPGSRLRCAPPRTPRRNSYSPKKPALQEIIFADGSMDKNGNENVVEKLEPERKPLKKKVVSSLSGRTSCKDSQKDGFCEDSNSMGLDNPTLATLEVLQCKQAVLVQK